MSKINSLPNKTIRQGDYRISIMALPWDDQVRISLIRYSSSGKAYNVSYENGIMIQREVKEGEVTQPMIKMPLDVYYEFVKLVALAETPVEEEVTKAELRATKAHLRDMQKLVFKKQPVVPEQILVTGQQTTTEPHEHKIGEQITVTKEMCESHAGKTGTIIHSNPINNIHVLAITFRGSLDKKVTDNNNCFIRCDKIIL